MKHILFVVILTGFSWSNYVYLNDNLALLNMLLPMLALLCLYCDNCFEHPRCKRCGKKMDKINHRGGNIDDCAQLYICPNIHKEIKGKDYQFTIGKTIE